MYGQYDRVRNGATFNTIILMQGKNAQNFLATEENIEIETLPALKELFIFGSYSGRSHFIPVVD